MSSLRWSEELDVVDENDTIVYAVSSDVGAMIVGYQQQKVALRERNTQIAVLQTRVAAMQDTINELNRREDNHAMA